MHTCVQSHCKHENSSDLKRRDAEDSLFVEGVASLQFGHLALSQSSVVQPGGYPEEVMTEALVLVSCLLVLSSYKFTQDDLYALFRSQ